MIKTSNVRIDRISTAQQLAALGTAWNVLSGGVPFRSYDWLESWWRAYGSAAGDELMTLAAYDEGHALVGLAPWYVASATSRARVIRFLGSGEVCSDYLTVLAVPGRESDVTAGVADWLHRHGGGGDRQSACWDALELSGIHVGDQTVLQLVRRLAAQGNLVHRWNRASCWRVELPDSWCDYLRLLSRSHRKQIRRLDRNYFSAGRAKLHIARSEDDLVRGLQLLARLHQRRWQTLGGRGCFSSPQFAAFHLDTADRLLRAGTLRLAWLDLDGESVAAEYQIASGDVVYAYQSGIEPAALVHQPGRLITMATMRLAIDEGRTAFDFLRGDELYKAHFRAEPRAIHDFRVSRDTLGARLRHRLWLAGGQVKGWLKRGLQRSADSALSVRIPSATETHR